LVELVIWVSLVGAVGARQGRAQKAAQLHLRQ